MPAQAASQLEIRIRWPDLQTIRYAVIREHLPLSQRIERFELWAERAGKEICLFRGTTVGFKRIVSLAGCRTDSVLLRITDARGTPAVEQVGFY